MTPGFVPAEPERWILVFSRTSKIWWVRWLACGRYKHVSAYAYLPHLAAWLHYDVLFPHTVIQVVRDDAGALPWLGEVTRDADLMAFTRLPDRGVRFRIGMWCVPAIKHLIGLRSGALRPDRLWRDCLRAGGDPLNGRYVRKLGATAAALYPAGADGSGAGGSGSALDGGRAAIRPAAC